MRNRLVPPLLAALLALALPGGAAADPVHVLSADAHGVTLQITAEPGWTLSAPGADGRVRVLGVPQAHSLADPGHGVLPAYSALLALPADARPTVRVLSAGAPVTRDGVRLAIADTPGFHKDDRGEYVPDARAATPLTDGAWPPALVVLGTPNDFRGRRLVGVEARPFQYDESARQLRVTPTLLVRVDFNRPAGAAALPAAATAPDPHFDDALRTTVLNWTQAAAWRVAPARAIGASVARARGATRPAAVTGVDVNPETGVEVRVQIDSTGIWQLPFSTLAAYGFPTGVPVAQVSVHRHEYLEGGAAPYGIVDIPIEVDDVNANGVFDAGDRIWVYVRNWAERSQATYPQRTWGDGEVIFVTYTAAGGVRVPTRSGYSGATGLPLLSAFPLRQHLEQDLVQMTFVAQPADTAMDLWHWTNQINYYPPNRSDLSFGVNDIDTTHAVGIKTSWVGRTFEDRIVGGFIVNAAGQTTTLPDSIDWYGKSTVTDSVTLTGSALRSGTNHYMAWGRNGPLPASPTPADIGGLLANVGFDWFEVSYWRRFKAMRDVLTFNSADATGPFQVHADGFLADTVRVWDVTDPDHPVHVTTLESHDTALGTETAAFDLQDTVVAGVRRAYVAAVLQAPVDPNFGPLVPPAANFSRVTRNLVSASGGGDYLVVAPQAFMNTLLPLLQLRASQGLTVLKAPLEQLQDEFNGGRRGPAAIRRFTQWAYAHWQSRFLLLVGDGTLDPLNHGGFSGPDVVPVNPVPGPVPVGDGFELTVSDNYYGCLTGNCDPIGFNTGPVVPELMIGRLPVNSTAELQVVVNKLVNYESVSGDPAWRRHVLLLSDDAFSSGTTFGGGGSGSSDYCEKPAEEHFVGLNTKVRSVMVDPAEAGLSQFNVELFNERYYLAGEQWTFAAGDTCRPDRSLTQTHTHALVTPVLFSHINTGTLWVSYQGHANEAVLTHEDLYRNYGDSQGDDDRFLYANHGQYFLWTAFSCHSNMFAYSTGGEGGPHGGCIGEDMVRMVPESVLPGYSDTGAIAAWASVCFEVVPRDDSTHINVELARCMFKYPAHDATLSDRGARLVLGEAILMAFQNYERTVDTYGYERGLATTYTLLGDPATRMSIGRPQSIVTANGLAVTDGQPIRLRTPGDSLTLVADLVSTERLDSLRVYDSSSGVEVPAPPAAYAVAPAFPDTAGGGVYGGRRFRVTVGTHTHPQSSHWRFDVKDRDGLETSFSAAFSLDATLRVDGLAVHDGDDLSPIANLSLLLQSPTPIEPSTDVQVALNNTTQPFQADTVAGDPSHREWVLTLPHAEFPKDDYLLRTTVKGQAVTRTFKVSTATGDLRIANLFAFPNPFDNDGTNFSFSLLGSDLADVRISVFTITGRKLWSETVHALAPGYHQLPWNGNDAEGSSIANGVYLYRLSASTAAGKHAEVLGRLVKLRRPRHVDVSTTTQ